MLKSARSVKSVNVEYFNFSNGRSDTYEVQYLKGKSIDRAPIISKDTVTLQRKGFTNNSSINL